MPAPPPAPRVSILSMMKDEGPRLLEWLAYHRLIGATEVFVYTNDCRDGTDGNGGAKLGHGSGGIIPLRAE